MQKSCPPEEGKIKAWHKNDTKIAQLRRDNSSKERSV